MDEMLGFVTVDYSAIIEVEERTMETLSLEALCIEALMEELLGMPAWDEGE
jgi:hypothetical protein